MYNSTEFYTYPAGEQSGRVKGNSRKGGEKNKQTSVSLSTDYQQIVDKTVKDVQRNLLTEA